MPFLAGRCAWPSALSRARSLRLSERSGRPLREGAGGSGAGFQQEGQGKATTSCLTIWPTTMCAGASPGLVYLEQGGYRGRKGGRYVKTLVHPKSVEIPNGRSVSGVEG